MSDSGKGSILSRVSGEQPEIDRSEDMDSRQGADQVGSRPSDPVSPAVVLVAIIELDDNSNEDAFIYADWWAKLEVCKAVGIEDPMEAKQTQTTQLGRPAYPRGHSIVGADGHTYMAVIRGSGVSGPPTNTPRRTRRPGDSDWPADVSAIIAIE